MDQGSLVGSLRQARSLGASVGSRDTPAGTGHTATEPSASPLPPRPLAGAVTCAACGTRLPALARFCGACGTPTTPAPAPSLAALAGDGADRDWSHALRRPVVGLILLMLLGVGLPLLALRVGAAPGATGSQRTLTGTLDLLQAPETGSPTYAIPDGRGTGCIGQQAYADVAPGMQIRVEDARGELLGQGTLAQGQLSVSIEAATRACSFPFAVQHLPVADVYEIVSAHREPASFTRADLDATDWTVTLTIGP